LAASWLALVLLLHRPQLGGPALTLGLALGLEPGEVLARELALQPIAVDLRILLGELAATQRRGDALVQVVALLSARLLDALGLALSPGLLTLRHLLPQGLVFLAHLVVVAQAALELAHLLAERRHLVGLRRGGRGLLLLRPLGGLHPRRGLARGRGRLGLLTDKPPVLIAGRDGAARVLGRGGGGLLVRRGLALGGGSLLGLRGVEGVQRGLDAARAPRGVGLGLGDGAHRSVSST
jgi:hypothetical protein